MNPCLNTSSHFYYFQQVCTPFLFSVFMSLFFSVGGLSFPFFLPFPWFLPLTTIYKLVIITNALNFILIPLWSIKISGLSKWFRHSILRRANIFRLHREENSYSGDFFCNSCGSTSQIQEERKTFLCPIREEQSNSSPFTTRFGWGPERWKYI